MNLLHIVYYFFNSAVTTFTIVNDGTIGIPYWIKDVSKIWVSGQTANEEFETFFAKSFNLTPIRLFPYTMAELTAGLTHAQRDVLSNISSTKFTK